ncbi:diacylglycerol/lipid kinase family protein [Pediococcus claussenii]|uniref:Diacylglycerol kinase family protein n=1 Tax=Pediococcus claussenii (strain ATCC BAA-344 / DSM 14800 / JCM 18046 / KCTC 3811 / LMG 21948 / P06) TaxID=701521 RepID=G8PEB9_PEDCP|nr:diacylglycerol kinase family protein [Pediococcus claussenii]AEV94380.1 diacylglycerol kinase family protein [Pediococcus claussenii ATCC BAA-344]ANZ69601.1 diacylglycerol kinase [Pediococcus claussenii]ANZ71418.1 diacylglycerol kinase [Pediococcus claussenii]KRN19358.1 hypothetical protein IV79_GL001408 [Pediococcus claussenii]
MKYFFIVNRHAGADRSANVWDEVHQLLVQKKINFDAVETEYPQHAIQLARDFADQEEPDSVVVAVGGDGTLLEVLNGVRNSKNHLPIGYIPAGSGNDFARQLEISADPTMAMQRMVNTREARPLDIGASLSRRDGMVRYFTNNIGIGFDAKIVHKANTNGKSSLSKWHLESMAYISAIFQTLFQQKGFEFDLEIDDEKFHFENMFLASITNIEYFGGGVGIAPKASLTDGKLDIVLAEKMTTPKFVQLFAQLVTKGTHLDRPEVFFRQVERLKLVTGEAEYMQVNGESFGPSRYDLEVWVEQQDFWM